MNPNLVEKLDVVEYSNRAFHAFNHLALLAGGEFKTMTPDEECIKDKTFLEISKNNPMFSEFFKSVN